MAERAERDLGELLDLSGQVALVTGASRGIGRATALMLGRAGARLALIGRTEATLVEVAGELVEQGGAGEPLVLPTDVALEDQVQAALDRVRQDGGRLDILVNNAGLISAGPLDQIDPAEWHRVLEANLTGAYLCSRAAAPLMRERQYGRIVNISSISAQTGGVSGGVHYASSKGGMLAMTKTLARDLAPHGITVNSVTPGQIDTDPALLTPEGRQQVMAMIPLGRLGLPDDIAHAVLFLASPMASYITGATLDVNGGILKR
jgi:3-oxoacyl-[acyl-carrier protein] reductase